MNRNKKIFFICLAVLLTILFNVALLLIPAKATWLDASEHKLYTLSEETKKYLASIDEPITIYLLNADGSEASLEYYLERFCQYNRNLTLKKEDAENCGELLGRVEMSAENVAAYTLVLVGEKREAVLKYSDLFYYQTDNETLNSMGLTQMSTSQYVYYAQLFSQSEQYADYYNLLLSESYLYFKGEAGLISMIEYVSAEIIPTHYILTGHGETDLSTTLFAQIAITFGGGYQPLDLTVSETVPADAASVLLFAPKEDYSTREIDALRTYVEDGGLLTVVTGQDQLSFVHLMSFLGEYGLSVTDAVVKQEIKVLDDDESEEPTTEISASVDAYVNV
ncbi:MAG: Gldg family protein, partial [Clostridia bacterium]|nr:Gldg family protein [Clostridia bacterium]